MRLEEFEQRLNRLLDDRRSWDDDPQIAALIRESAEHRELARAYRQAVSPRTLRRISLLGLSRGLETSVQRRTISRLSAGNSPVSPAVS